MTMKLLPGRRTRLTRFPADLTHASREQGFGGTVVRNESKTARQWPVNCHGINLNPLGEKTGERTCSRRHVDADLAETEGDVVGSPLQKAHARRFSRLRETDVDAEDCTLISQVRPALTTTA